MPDTLKKILTPADLEKAVAIAKRYKGNPIGQNREVKNFLSEEGYSASFTISVVWSACHFNEEN